MHAFKCNQRFDGIIYKQFQSFSLQRKNVKNTKQHIRKKSWQNGELLIIWSNKEIKDATSFYEEDEYKMFVVIKKDTQEFKNTQILYWIYPYSSLWSIDI
jgi:hypothetical protein